MKLRHQHILGIARTVAKALQAAGHLVTHTSLPEIEERIQAVVEANLAAERALDGEAHRLLDAQLRKPGAPVIDEARAFQLIKRELAKQKGIVL